MNGASSCCLWPEDLDDPPGAGLATSILLLADNSDEAMLKDDDSDDPAAKLVSIVIPTLNEERTLPLALGSIEQQGHRSHETIVVDSGSTDRTREIALESGARVIVYPGRTMGARHAGLKESRGRFVLYLDADQVLREDTLERALVEIAGRDMLILGEESYQPKGFLQISIARNRKWLHEVRGGAIPPHLYPRFFRRRILLEAYESIPEETMSKVFAHDDSLLFRRLSSLSERIGMVENAVWHIEEEDWISLMRHAFRTGRSARAVRREDLKGLPRSKEGLMQRFSRAVKSRSLFVSAVREFFFFLGYRT